MLSFDGNGAIVKRLLVAVACCLVLLGIVDHYWKRIRTLEPKRLILIHDGGVDDISALLVLLGAPRAFEVKAVLVQPADSYQDTAVFSTLYTLNALNLRGIHVASGHDEGENPFPPVWREQSDKVAEALLQLDLPQNGYHNSLGTESAVELLVRLLSERPHTLVITGPVTFLGRALRLDPTIARNIEHVYIMGGAVEVDGNVDKSPHAEWNFYNSPKATQLVIQPSLADRITLVGLDVTRFVPVNQPLQGNQYFGELLERQGKKHYLATLIAKQVWDVVLKDETSYNLYHLWDTLTAVVAVKPDIIKTKNIRLRVKTDKGHEGRTEPTKDGDGAPVNVGVAVDKDHFSKVLLNCLRY